MHRFTLEYFPPRTLACFTIAALWFCAHAVFAEEAQPEAEPVRAAAGLSSLDDRTVVNRDLVGPLESLTLVAADGREVDLEASGVTFTEGDRSYEFTVPAGRLSAIVIEGEHGIVQLVQAPPAPEGGDPDRLRLADGLLDCMNGRVSETLLLPRGYKENDGAPADYRVRIDGAEARVVALRDGEIAVAGEEIPLPGTGGTSRIEITTPTSETLESTVPAWGFQLRVPNVTLRRTPVEVTLQVVGLQAHEAIQFEFFPEPGQEIDPLEVTVAGNQAASPIAVARLSSRETGPQTVNYRLRPAAVPEAGQ